MEVTLTWVSGISFTDPQIKPTLIIVSPVLPLTRSLSLKALVGVCPTAFDLKILIKCLQVHEDCLLESKSLLLSEAIHFLFEQVWGWISSS